MEIKIMANISKKLIHGKGSKGEGVSGINGKHTKAYATWRNMLGRCYDQKFLSRQPTYTNCSVCEEWLSFPNFQSWFDVNYTEGFQLDKDLLMTGNKIYSPETCVFVPQSINSLFTDHGRARGEYPIGVHLHKQAGKFVARLRIDGTYKYLGYFNTVGEASQAYQLAKKENVIRVADEWKDKISDKLYNALIRKAEELIGLKA